MLVIVRLGRLDEERDIPAKAFSLPVITMAPMSLSASYLFRASLSSAMRVEERALRALGRFRVTGSLVSTHTECLTEIITHLVQHWASGSR